MTTTQEPEYDPFVPDSNQFEHLPTKASTDVYRRVGASLAAYNRILLQPLDVQLRSGWNPDRDSGSKVGLQEARSRIAVTFQQEMVDAIQASGRYTVATGAGADVLEVRPRIIDLYVKAVDDAANAGSNVSTYEVHDAELTFAGDLSDSMTGTVLYRVYDHRTAGVGTLQLKTTEDRNLQLRKLAAHWAKQLIDALDAARASATGS
ncbi:MAG: DUF3313 family protein [Povalibacter sp.]